MKEMNADNLFFSLGYEKGEVKDLGYIEFYKKYPETNEMASISFELFSKTVMASIYYDINKLQKSRALAMTPRELQATYEFAKELKWID